MYRALIILTNRFLSFICKVAKKNGSVFPGSITFHMDFKILTKIKYPKYVIGITGSSGKGSTTEVVAHILKNAGYDVVYNKSGSNGVRALATLILNNCSLLGKFRGDVLLLEIDERHIHLAFPRSTLTHLLITNITRDQPARNIHPDSIYEFITRKITSDTELIINADDPLVSKVKTTHLGRITTYGLSRTEYSYDKPVLEVIDNAYCPKCFKKLNYAYYHYGHLGSYVCSTCDFGRCNVDYEAKEINLDKQEMIINKNKVHINKNILYAAYYTTAAYALCSTLGISKKTILHALNDDFVKPKRANIYMLDNRKFNMLESKNENALSYYQSLRYIVDQDGVKSVILGFDNVSRRYEFNDLSWLWDVEFEMLNDKSVDKIICIGRFKYDVATRLEYAGINKKKLILVENLNDLLNITELKSKGDIYTMVCFDMTYAIKKMLRGDYS